MTFAWTEDNTVELERLWATDLTTREIGAQLGCSKNAVIGKAGRMNLPMRQNGRRQLTSEQKSASKVRQRQKQRVYNARWIAKRTAKPRLRLIAREGRLLEPLNISFGDLERGMCRFPTIERDGAQFFCGRPQEHGTSYCDDCCRIALTPDGYENVINRRVAPLRQPMNGYVAKPFRMVHEIAGHVVREVPFG